MKLDGRLWKAITFLCGFLSLFGVVSSLGVAVKLFFFIRTSNFGAEVERSYFFFRFEVENVLKTFLEDLSTFQ